MRRCGGKLSRHVRFASWHSEQKEGWAICNFAHRLTANNPLSSLNDFDKEKKVFLNYWKALAKLLGGEDNSVLYKYNGVQLFCMFSAPFFMKCQNLRSYTTDTMMRLLSSVFDNMEGEYAGVGHSDWWRRGGQASLMNRAALPHVMQDMARALHNADANGAAIEL